MVIKVHLLDTRGPEALHVLKSKLDENVHLSMGSELPSPPDYHILVGGRPERLHLTASPNLRALIIPFAGLPDSARDLMREFPEVAVHNLHHNAAPTAEMALALLLAAAKFLVPIDRALREHDWTPRYQPNPSLLLEGKNALVLGFGHIGQRVGRICHALGMKVLAVRRRPEFPVPPDIVAEIYPVDMLHTLLKRSEALIITLPRTQETDGMIGEKELSLMPAGGMLVNVGRGSVVDQAALYYALLEGKLSAAGLDVWYNYPSDPDERKRTPPSDYPFHELDNVVMSPHRGGGSNQTEIQRMIHLADLLNAAARAAPIPNKVDLEAGY